MKNAEQWCDFSGSWLTCLCSGLLKSCQHPAETAFFPTRPHSDHKKDCRRHLHRVYQKSPGPPPPNLLGSSSTTSSSPGHFIFLFLHFESLFPLFLSSPTCIDIFRQVLFFTFRFYPVRPNPVDPCISRQRTFASFGQTTPSTTPADSSTIA